jgi:hypothetical protein
MNTPLELDHIDPKWKEGRDYQLVCGLSCAENLFERERGTNSRKSNRFLPWRISSSEIGSIPTNPGDLCLFLDLTTGEWVLEEFMGEWWFEQTKSLCGESISGKQNAANGIGAHSSEHLGKGAKVCYEKKVGIHSPESKEKALKVKREKKVGFHNPEVQSRAGKLTKGKKWWVNKFGETIRSFTSPGEGWVNGRIWVG